MSNPVAVIDLGTNTFHLLIAKQTAGRAEILLKRVDPVKLGEGGITKGLITNTAFERGLSMLATYADLCAEHGATEISAIATSAIRNAGNGAEFVRRVKAASGIAIAVIDGEQEARTIYRGVRAAGCLDERISLVLDIGGGSVECILCTAERILWKESFEIGAARLMERFHQQDPIPPDAQHALFEFLDQTLQPLFRAAQEFKPQVLAGSAGAFETFAELADRQLDIKSTVTFGFEFSALRATLDRIIASGRQQRKDDPRIDPVRVDMVVTAALLTRYILEKTGIRDAVMTTWSLKEGVLAELFDVPRD